MTSFREIKTINRNWGCYQSVKRRERNAREVREIRELKTIKRNWDRYERVKRRERNHREIRRAQQRSQARHNYRRYREYVLVSNPFDTVPLDNLAGQNLQNQSNRNPQQMDILEESAERMGFMNNVSRNTSQIQEIPQTQNLPINWQQPSRQPISVQSSKRTESKQNSEQKIKSPSLQQKLFGQISKQHCQIQIPPTQNPHSKQKNYYQNYIDAIAFLQDHQNQTNFKDQLYNQTNYSRFTQCSICFETYDQSFRKPMNVCPQSKSHIMCTQCLLKETNIKDHSRCYICRTPVKKQQIKEETDILAWLNLNQRLQIQFPTALGFIPQELHESLRKISFHQMCQLETNRLILKKDHTQQKLIKFSILNQKLSIMQKEKTDQLNEIQQKLRKQTQKYEKVKRQTENIHYLTKDFIQYSEQELWKWFDALRTEMEPKAHIIEKVNEKLKDVFADLIKHQNKVHDGKSLYRNHISQLFIGTSINLDTFPYITQEPIRKCFICEQIIAQAKGKLISLQYERISGTKPIHTTLKKHAYWFVKFMQTILPKNLQDLIEPKIQRTQIIDSKEEQILRQVYEQHFSAKIDIAQFHTLINPKSLDKKKITRQNNQIIKGE